MGMSKTKAIPAEKPKVKAKPLAKPIISIADPEPAIPTIPVPDLLAESMSWHMKAKPQAGGKPRPHGWLEMLKKAKELRELALEMDPGRTDPAWATTGNHDALMAFYADKVGK